MKRPLMGLCIAMTAGVAAGWLKIPAFAAILGLLLGCYMVKRWTDSSYKYILGLSVFFVVGLCRILSTASQETEVLDHVLGKVIRVQEKTNVYYLFVEDQKEQNVLVVIKKEQSVHNYYKGQIYSFEGTGEVFEYATNPGQFDEAEYYRSQDISYRLWADTQNLVDEGSDVYQCLRVIEQFKFNMCGFFEQHMDSEGNGILQAAVLGERTALDSDLKRYYQENGWMHLITTSGLHLTFVAMNMYKRLRKMTVPIEISTGISLLLMLAYGYMTDFGDSMLRAMGMMVLGLTAKLLGRKTDGWTSLFLLAALMLFIRPERIGSVGFLLTYAAVGGMEFGTWLAKSCGKAVWKQKVCVQIGIFISTLPVLVCSMYEVPVFGFFYNFFMIPLISIIVPLAFFAGICGVFQILVFRSLAVAVLNIIDVLLKLVHQLPSKVWTCGRPKDWQCVLFCLGIMAAVGCMYLKKRKISWTIMTMSCCFLLFIRVPVNRVVFVDVGQGDGICVFTDSGEIFIVDGGSTDVKSVYAYRLEPVLKYYGVDTIDGWFLTHGDKDHVSGILEALEKEVKIKQIFLPDVYGDEMLDEIAETAEMQGIFVSRLSKGDRVCSKGLTMKCLYPQSHTLSENKNNASLVLEVNINSGDTQSTLLLMGDLENEGEQMLIESGCLGKTDILKAGHHGSSGSTSDAFLEYTQPEWAVISCGENNSYGHPHQETLERLLRADVSWVSTSKLGAIITEFDANGYCMYGYRYQKQD